MSSKDIHITDLANPVFNKLEKEVMAAAEAAPPVVLTEEAILNAACAVDGLSDFGPDDFRARLAVWLQAFKEDTGLNALGRAGVFGFATRYATMRLRVEDIIKRHPEILKVKINRPAIVSGLPRSGTTHLINVLSKNPDLRSMHLWETIEPVPPPGEAVSFEDTVANPRYKRTKDMWYIADTVLEYWRVMHEVAIDHIHEELELHGIDFSSCMPEWISRIPTWTEYYYRHDQTPHYAYVRKIIQAMTWLKQGGSNRWIMKSVQNMENLHAVLNTYPDAMIIITHRDPVAVLQSTMTMTAHWDRIRRINTDLPGLATIWINRIEHLLRGCVRDRDSLPSGQVLDVLFHEYMADQRGAIDKIYKASDLPLSSEADRLIDKYLSDNPRNKLGRMVYDLHGDFGVDVAALRRRWQFYYDRFPVQIEPTLGE